MSEAALEKNCEEFDPDEPEQPNCIAVPASTGKLAWSSNGSIIAEFCRCGNPQPEKEWAGRFCSRCKRPFQRPPGEALFYVNGQWVDAAGNLVLKSTM